MGIKASKVIMQLYNFCRKAVFLCVIASIFLFVSCTTPQTGKTDDHRKIIEAERLLADGQLTDAVLICADLARKDPLMPGLAETQRRITSAITAARSKAAAQRAKNTRAIMETDISEGKSLPATYGLQLTVKGETDSLRTPETPMEKMLKEPVTVHLDGVNLNDFILAMGASEGVNIIADSMDNTATMAVHAENVPLAEILDFVSRNLGIAFYVGENIIWATPQPQQQAGIPLETRMYRLRKGMSSDEIANNRVNIVDAIERFIPKIDTSDLLFDKKAHVLLVKNTRDNLMKVEQLIEKLDVCPPQVLIEARFISIGANDLSELGIDWLLKSSSVVSEKMMPNETGGRTLQPHTQIDQGATISFAPFPNLEQGLNMTYQGLLTAPLFEAVVHALNVSGKSKTLSAPKITTVNNRPATIRIGEDFRYFDQFDIQSIPSTVTDAGTTIYSAMLVPVGSPQLEELGIQLGVTPSVGSDMGSITLNMIPEISEFVRYETYQVGTDADTDTSGTATTNTSSSIVKIPIFRRSKIETEVIVQSGETVVMGGLISSSENKVLSKIPILSSIPLIGKLFTRDDVQEAKQNLLIFVTASILSERGENLVPMVPLQQADAEENK